MGAQAPEVIKEAVEATPSDHGPVEPDTKCNAAIRKSKKLCGQAAGWGTKHPGIGRCKRHGGASPSYDAEVQRLAAKRALQTYGQPIAVDPRVALLEMLAASWGHVSWLRIKVDELKDEGADANMVGPVGGGQGGYPEFKPNVYIGMYDRERKFAMDLSKNCIAAGIEERRVKIAEEQGAMIASVISSVLSELKVTGPEVPKVVGKHLRQLAQGMGAQAA